MQLTQDYIGKEVRWIVISLKKSSGDFVHIFSIFEKMDEDMQDYHDFVPNHGNEFNDYDRGADGKDDNYKQELPSILPRRHCPRYVRCCVPNEEPDIIKQVLEDSKLNKQLKVLSEKNLGYDLTLHRKYLGG